MLVIFWERAALLDKETSGVAFYRTNIKKRQKRLDECSERQQIQVTDSKEIM